MKLPEGNDLIFLGKIIGVLYVIALINRIVYLTKIYRMDLQNLTLQGKSEVAAMRTKMIREGTMRYAGGAAEGIIKEVERVAEQRIQRRKADYWHDIIGSVVTTITTNFKK